MKSMKYKTFFRIGKYIFLWFIYFVICTKSSYSLTISPATVEIETEPGVTSNFSIKVYNESSKPLKMSAYVWDLVFDKHGNKIYSPPSEKSKSSIARFIEPSEKEFFLEGKETKQVNILINVPKGIVGGNSAIVFFNALPAIPKDSKKALVAVATRLGATVLQETSGSIEIKSRITSIQINRPDKTGPLMFEMKAKNEGNSFINAAVVVGILGDKNNFLGSFKLEKKIIPPKSEGVLNMEIKLDLPGGLYHAIVTYQYKGKSVTIDKPFQLN